MSETSVLEGEMSTPNDIAIDSLELDGVSARVVRAVKQHTSIGTEQLRLVGGIEFGDESEISLDEILRRLQLTGWIELRGQTWTLTEKGEESFADATTGVSTEDEVVGLDDGPTKPYDVAKLKVEQRPLSVFQALRKIEKKEIVLNPDFQRAFVWDEVRQSRLIESILIRIPLPAFYLDATDAVQWNVVDGLQRLSTLYRYCRGTSFPLVGLEFLVELSGKRFLELPQKYQVMIEDDTQLIFNNLLPGTPAKAKFTIFSRVNTGGMQLTAQEIRHALNQGPITGLLRRIASSNVFLDATERAVDSRRMSDRELILRTLAFAEFGLAKYPEYGDLDAFLVDAMEKFNQDFSPVELNRIEKEFFESLTKIHAIFGRYSFRKFYVRGGRRSPLNKALFEAWLSNARNYSADLLESRREVIIDLFIKAMNEDALFVNSVTYGTGKVSAVRTRFNKINGILAEACL